MPSPLTSSTAHACSSSSSTWCKERASEREREIGEARTREREREGGLLFSAPRTHTLFHLRRNTYPPLGPSDHPHRLPDPPTLHRLNPPYHPPGPSHYPRAQPPPQHARTPRVCPGPSS
eukprot:1681270-Rhodomonas_salina.2